MFYVEKAAITIQNVNVVIILATPFSALLVIVLHQMIFSVVNCVVGERNASVPCSNNRIHDYVLSSSCNGLCRRKKGT